MRIAGLDTSFIDGDGIAFVVFFQGCTLRCPHCHNPELQSVDGGIEVAPEEVLQHLDMDFYDSVVFSGGEPLGQPEALQELAKYITLPKWLYTGWELSQIPWHIGVLMDVIVAGPYRDDLRTGGFPASSNQIVWRRSDAV